MINDHGARSNDPDESSVVVADGGGGMLVDVENSSLEHSVAVHQDSERRQAAGRLHGDHPGGPLFARGCSIDLQIVEGVHLHPGSGISLQSDGYLRIRFAEVDREEDVQESRWFFLQEERVEGELHRRC